LVKTIESIAEYVCKQNLWSLLKNNNSYKDRNSVREVYTGPIYQFNCMKKFLQDPKNFTMFFLEKKLEWILLRGLSLRKLDTGHRTQEETLSYAEQVVERGNPFKGVKRFSQLLFVPGFDMPNIVAAGGWVWP
jgi:hypothetical protein